MKILRVKLGFFFQFILILLLFYLLIFFNSYVDLLKYETQYKKRNLLDFTKYLIFSIQPNFEITNKSILVSLEKSVRQNLKCCNYINLNKNIELVNLEINNNAFKELTSNLPSSGRIYQSAKLQYPNNKWEEIQFRFRGQSIYHHDSNLPSLRLNLKKEKSLNYMNHINLTKPEDPYQISNFYSDFIFENEGMIVQKHKLVNVIINKVNYGLYHKHHRRDENLIRANKRLPGPLFVLNKKNNKKWEPKDFELKGEAKIYNNQVLIEELIKTINAIDIEKKYNNIDDLWNIANKEKFAKFFALLNLIGSFHTDSKHNLMLYFDPSIGKFEPIIDDPLGFGATAFPRTTKRIFNLQNIPDYSVPIYERSMPLYNAMLTDKSFIDLKNQYLMFYLDKYNPKVQFEYIDKFYDQADYFIKNDIKKRAVFETLTGFKSIPISNFDFLQYKKKLKNWIIKRHSFLHNKLKINQIRIEYYANKNDIYLDLFYKTNLKILFKPDELMNALEVKNEDEKFIEFSEENIIKLLPYLKKTNYNKYEWANEIRYKEYFESNEKKISFKVKESNFDKVKTKLQNSFFNSFNKNKIKVELIKINSTANDINYSSINNYKKNNLIKNIVIEDTVIIKENMIINPYQTLIVKAGSKILIDENVSIISYGKIKMLGNEDNNIEILPYKKNTNWGVVALIGKNSSKSIFKNVTFKGGSNKIFNKILLKGMLSIHWADDIEILNSKFQENFNADDVLNVVHSNIIINNSEFKKCFMDCIDFDYSNGQIINSFFKKSGNDLLDFMESKVKIENVFLNSSEDKCLSAGEKSMIEIYRSIFKNCKVGIASKDESNVKIYKTKFINNTVDTMKYRKNLTYSYQGLISENI